METEVLGGKPSVTLQKENISMSPSHGFSSRILADLVLATCLLEAKGCLVLPSFQSIDVRDACKCP